MTCPSTWAGGPWREPPASTGCFRRCSSGGPGACWSGTAGAGPLPCGASHPAAARPRAQCRHDRGATIIAAPSSTKNADQQRESWMNRSRKGNQWHFGMTVHIGATSETRVVHCAVVTGADLQDKHPVPGLLHGPKKRVSGDPGHQGCGQLIQAAASDARHFTRHRCTRPIRRRGRAIAQAAQGSHPDTCGACLPGAQATGGYAKVLNGGVVKNARRSWTALATVNVRRVARRVSAAGPVRAKWPKLAVRPIPDGLLNSHEQPKLHSAAGLGSLDQRFLGPRRVHTGWSLGRPMANEAL
ncbi:MAG: transposase [Burkholderiales bacterium]|nr:transposase [Burkholderiales bacterium]